MFIQKTRGHTFRITVTILCILGMLASNAPNPSAPIGVRASQSIRVQADEEPERARSNHDTQIKATGPSGVRINTWNGNLFYPFVILTIPGRGLPLELTLSYNSGWHAVDKHYGYGWQLSYNMLYTRDDSGNVTVAWEDGRTDTFVKSGGSFLAPVDTYNTLREYQPARYVLRTKYDIEFYFDQPIHKRLTRIQEPNGNSLTLGYNADLLLTTATDASGRQLHLAYAGGRLSTITNPGAAPGATFQYDISGDLIGVTDPLGNATQYGYGADHFLISITDAKGQATSITYTDGAVTQATRQAVSKSFAYDRPNHTSVMTDVSPGGDQVTRFVYDPEGRISRSERLKDSAGQSVVRSFVWDDHNNLANLTDENGRTTRYAYDAMGNLVVITNTLGYTTTYAYESVYNRITHTTDANGHTQSFQYDARGNLVAAADALGNETTYTYDVWGNRISSTDPLSHTTHYAHDVYGDVISATDALGHSTGAVYDLVGNALSTTDANSNTVTYTYDSLNRPITETNALSETVLRDYDAAGNLIRITDAKGHALDYGYDSLSRPVTVTNAAQGRTLYAYDPPGNLIHLTDAAGHAISRTYDRLNRLTAENDALGYTAVYTYDGVGNLIARTDANGATTSYSYGDLNRLTGVDYPDAAYDASYSYDRLGNRTVESNPDVTVLHTFDALDRIVRVDNVLSAFTKTISYTYDAAGNRLTMTEPDGGVSTCEYDEANRIVRLTNSLGQVTRYTYDPGGRLSRKDLHNGTYALYTYDRANRLLSVENHQLAGQVISIYTYEYDAAGLRTRVTDANSQVITYTYDALNQLTQATYSDGSFQAYAYDAVGNRLILTDTASVTHYSYDEANRLQSAGPTAYGWDKNGNLISKTNGISTTTYAYDYENRLVRVTLPDGHTNLFAYYPDGRRLSKTDASGQTTYYFYDGLDAILELDGLGATLARYTSGLGIDDWISMEREGVSYYYHQDGLDSITGLTDAGQALVATWQYDAFGGVTGQTGAVTNPYLFTGREYDAESELYYYRARMYDPLTGRFISRDPAGVAVGDLNLYRYVKNSPVNAKDALGLDPWFYNYIGPGNRGYDKDPVNAVDTAAMEHDKAYDTAKAGGTWDALTRTDLWQADLNLARDSFGSVGHNNSVWADVVAVGVGTTFGLIGGVKAGVEVVQNAWNGLFGDSRSSANNYSTYNSSYDVHISGHTYTNNGGGYGGGSYGGGGGYSGGGGYGTGGGGWGGGESKASDIAPSSFLQDPGSPHVPVEPAQFTSSVTLNDILPTQGPAGTAAVPVTPTFPLGGATNAVDAAAVDFVDTLTPTTRAAIFATQTISRPYEHDYSVCNRFQGYSLESAAALPLPGLLSGTTDIPWFWYVSLTKGALVEETFIFSVFVDEDLKTFTVDSRWLADYYATPPTPTFDYVFNFQIWALSSEQAHTLLRQTLNNLANYGSGWTVHFANTTEPVAPTVIIKSAESVGGVVRMTAQSWLTQTQTVRFFGSLRYASDRTTNVLFEYDKVIAPGFNTVELPLGNVIDAVVRVEANGFLDIVYEGSGFWFAFDDSGGGSKVNLATPNCAPTTNLTSRDLFLTGCAQITGTVAIHGWLGMGRGLNPNGRPTDVSPYKALTFFARGDGKSYRVGIETDAVRQHNSFDFHQFVFTAPPAGRQFVIPLASFAQQGWNPADPVALTGKDVKTVVWTSVGEPHDSIDLTIDQAAFVKSTLISGTTRLSNTADTQGPYTITTQIADDLGVQAAFLFYSVDGGHFFVQTPMTAQADTFSAAIPGQPLITEVRYYVEAADADGNVATDPVDVPYTTWRFQVSAQPFLLVDDFADTNPVNVLGGDSFLFGTDTGSSILAHYDHESLRLTYDVSTTGSYAGYVSALQQVNVTPYSAVSFWIKGAAGGEKAKVGLQDAQGHEPKIVVGEYLSHGITTDWQKVVIPRLAFTGVADWSDMARFVVSFDHRLGSMTGAVYVDDFKFEHIPLVPVVVDNYDDMAWENGLGGALWTFNDGATITTTYDPLNRYGDSGAGFRITYDGVTGSTWAGAETALGGLDASGYGYLSFYIKGAAGGERPNIYLVSRTGETETRRFVDLENYVPVTTAWQRVKIPLAHLAQQGVDLAHLDRLQIVFEWEEMAGTIYLDDVRFIYAPQAADDIASTLEDTPVTNNVMANDSDPNGDSLVTIVSAPAHGVATADGMTVTYTPTLDFSGADMFSYILSDGVLSSTAAITVTVMPVNDVPTLSGITDTSTLTNTPAVITFTIGDIDTPISALSLSAESSNTILVPDYAIVFAGLDITRTATITPSMNLTGTSTITIAVSDGIVATRRSLVLTVNQEPRIRVYLPLVLRNR